MSSAPALPPSGAHTEHEPAASWRFSVAPMMECTDRHYRFFARQLTRRALLYSEMVTCGAVIHGDREALLGFDSTERPLALQLGGDDPRQLAECARIAEGWGYDEVNLNVGCPSDRVQKGSFGACLMARPELVADCVDAMRCAVSLPVTVKHRIGIESRTLTRTTYQDLARFVEIVSSAGCRRFIVHARVAVLEGLSPKQNRTVPPLRYEDVYRLAEDNSGLIIVLNGGIRSIGEVCQHLQRVGGVMLGRAAYETPFLLARVDHEVFGEHSATPTRRDVALAMIPYLERWSASGGRLHHVTRHLLGLLAGRAGARHYRRTLSDAASLRERPPRELIELALSHAHLLNQE